MSSVLHLVAQVLAHLLWLVVPVRRVVGCLLWLLALLLVTGCVLVWLAGMAMG